MLPSSDVANALAIPSPILIDHGTTETGIGLINGLFNRFHVLIRHKRQVIRFLAQGSHSGFQCRLP